MACGLAHKLGLVQGARACIDLFDSVPEAKHHRVSLHFLSTSAGSLRSDVQQLADGGALTPALDVALVGIEYIPISEEGFNILRQGVNELRSNFTSGSYAFSGCRLTGRRPPVTHAENLGSVNLPETFATLALLLRHLIVQSRALWGPLGWSTPPASDDRKVVSEPP